MKLLQLPAEIQDGLLSPPVPLEIYSFSERSLKVLVSCRDEEIQSFRWQKLLHELKSFTGD